MFKNMRLVILFDMLLNPSFKMKMLARSFLSSFLVMFKLGLGLKMRFIAMSMVC